MKNLIKNKCKKIKEETGAASVLVLFTVLMFVVILMGAYMLITTSKRGQLESDIRIQEIYKEGVNEVDEVYYNIVDNYEYNDIFNEILINE
ncbi:MAG: hypothetical protein GX682_00405 [Clostridiaceae bacterium]|nr:hypothetical protein [Clostridiaceae bacterium]